MLVVLVAMAQVFSTGTAIIAVDIA